MGKEIANYLPGKKLSKGSYIECGDTTVSWCFGHILEQKMPEEYNPNWKSWQIETLPMVPDWALKIKPDAKEQFELLKRLIAQADEIVNAGDPDREGQLLVDEVLDFLGNRKPVMRLWLSAWDEASVKKALANIRPNSEYEGYYNAALARSRADWLVGINLTRAFTIAGRESGYDGVLSVGRVQTPTLALIVKRDELIEKHKQITHFGVAASFNHANGIINAKWQSGDDIVLDKSIAEAVANEVMRNNLGKITEYEVKPGKQQAPLPFNLSKLQVAASNQFGFSAQKTLDIAQSLYETHRATTYPRSDCQYLPISQHGDCTRIIKALPAEITQLMDINAMHSAFDDSKVTAHHAIIPTGVEPKGLSVDEQKLYDLICKSYAALFSPAAEYKTTKIKINVGQHTFSTSCLK
jgi:DNA topoisomerase-3